jgi:hypothetical protein
MSHDHESLAVEYSNLTVGGWQPWHGDFHKIPFTKLLQREAGLGLAEAKRVTDAVLDNKSVHIRVPTKRLDSFRNEAKAIGIRDIHVD